MRHTRPAIDSMVVVVPACNEEDLIDECLDALGAAINDLHVSRPDIIVETVVVLDACLDQTLARVSAHPAAGAISCDLRCVGAARALGITYALSQRMERHRAWIANTDADSRVPHDWLRRMLSFADDDADLVVGTVMPDDLPELALDRWLQSHQLTEEHPHVHGANLGIRADTYLALGGFGAIPLGEDVALVQRAIQADAKIVRTATLPVVTSARTSGRAPEGFAAYLDCVLSEVASIGDPTVVGDLWDLAAGGPSVDIVRV
jgi:GT2 family glycosyltransferase